MLKKEMTASLMPTKINKTSVNRKNTMGAEQKASSPIPSETNRKKQGKPDGRRAPKTKTKILDAAEYLFSRRGYYGVSLRNIADEAGVQLALSYYHFGTKEELFTHVIERRALENTERLEASLREALTVTGSQEEKRRAVVRAFVLPIIDKTMRHGKGWNNYIRLLAQIANLPQEEDFLTLYRNSFDEVVTNYVTALQNIHPEMDGGDVHWCFFFLQASLTHVLVESKLLDRQSRGRFHSRELDLIAEKMITFFSAGFSGFSDP